MAPHTEFQKLIGLIRAREELAILRRVPLEGLRDAVNGLVGARVPEGDLEAVAHDLRRALEGWLPSEPKLHAAPAAPALSEPAPARTLPRVGTVAAACEHPIVLSARAEPGRRTTGAWRWPLVLSWATFLAGCAMMLDAAGWSPVGALAGVASALSDVAFRALTGDPLSLGAVISGAGLLGVVLTNFWLLVRRGAPSAA